MLDVRDLPDNYIVTGVDKIGEIYAANYEMAARAGVDIDELPTEYCPHIYIDGEMREIDNIMLLSEDFELVEIPLTPIELGVPIKLTKYIWNEEN